MILLISSCCKLKKQTHLEWYVPVPLEQSLFYQIHTLIADLCLLLFNLKMFITISNWGFIWKRERYARKSQNDTTTNQIILKTLTWREWLSGLRRCKWIVRLLVRISLAALSGLGIQPRYETLRHLWFETWMRQWAKISVLKIDIFWEILKLKNIFRMDTPVF